jgi:hypothetical protein
MHIPYDVWQRLEKVVSYDIRSQACEHLWGDEKYMKKNIKRLYKNELEHGCEPYTYEKEVAKDLLQEKKEEEYRKRRVELHKKNRELYRQWLIENVTPEEVEERMKF